ncbi:hypothetical protein RI367_005214 [Sorochytrium milnesiophthora]
MLQRSWAKLKTAKSDGPSISQRANTAYRNAHRSVHTLYEKRMRRTQLMESADYEALDGPLVQRHAQRLRKLGVGRRVRQVIARMIMCTLIGVFAALLYMTMHHGIGYITAKRINFLRDHLGSGSHLTASSVAVGWAFTFFLALIMCFLGVACILYEPSAEGSGMPEVIAFLNGLKQPRYLTIKTFVFKLLGTFFIVGAGLFSGFDGPYIHTPLGGAMFALEEAMSFYEPSLIIRSLFAALISMLILSLSSLANSHGHIDNKKLSLYGSNATCDLVTPVQDYVAVAIMGVLGGVLGHLYNVTVAKIRVLRTAHIQKSIGRRFAEAPS